MTLRLRAFTAVRWTTVGVIIRAGLQVVQVAILARILTPEDYGLMAMATVILGFARLFSDFGVNSAFVQRRSVTQEQRSSLFWFNVLTSLVLSGLVIAASPLIAAFFGNARVAPLLALSSVTIVIGALGVQVRLAAEKLLRFRPVIIQEVIAATLGFGVAWSAALAGWGVYALITGAIASSIVSTALAWLVLAAGWRPQPRINVSEIRSFLGFGGALVANHLVNQINATIDIFLGGRVLTSSQLGFYSVPRTLTTHVQSVVNPIVTRVAFPLISEIQNDAARVKSVYLQALNMTASTNAPIYIGAAFFAPEIVSIVLGPDWLPSASILRALALWGAIRSIGNPVGSLLFGLGRADLSLKWNLALLVIVPPIVWMGAGFGPEMMAWVMFAVGLGLFLPAWLVLIRPISEVRLAEYTIAALRPFVLALVAVGAAYLVASIALSPFARLLLGVAVAAPLYLGLSFLCNASWVGAMRELAGRPVRG